LHEPVLLISVGHEDDIADKQKEKAGWQEFEFVHDFMDFGLWV